MPNRDRRGLDAARAARLRQPRADWCSACRPGRALAHQELSITLLFGLGLLLGLALGPVLASYVEADLAAVWQAAGATGAFVASLGAVGYATRRDLSSWYRVLFWALLGLILFGLVAIFVSIPNGNIIWSVAGLVIFGGYTILDCNRLRRSGQEKAVPIAASIFLDVLNVFLFFLQPSAGTNTDERRLSCL